MSFQLDAQENNAFPIAVWIGLGANMGDPVSQLVEARRALESSFQVFAVSSLYCSAPVDCLPGQDDYINAVMGVYVTCSPHTVLQQCFVIEQALGRVRTGYHAPRTLDLDLLLYGQEQLNDSCLTLPHPEMCARAFVLKPLQEVSPDLLLPQGGTPDFFLDKIRGQEISVFAHSAWTPVYYS